MILIASAAISASILLIVVQQNLSLGGGELEEESWRRGVGGGELEGGSWRRGVGRGGGDVLCSEMRELSLGMRIKLPFDPFFYCTFNNCSTCGYRYSSSCMD